MTIRKTIAASLLSLSVLGSVSLNAYAADNQARSDALSVRIVSDKEAYSSSEDVKVDIVVENKAETVNNLRIESVLPDKLKLKNGSQSAERASLAPNETVQLSAVLAAETPQTTTVTAAPATTTTTQATTAQPVDSPKTSDNNNMTYVIAVLLILTAVAFLTLTSRKTRTRVLSLFLCLALTGTFIDLRTVSAAGESIETLSARINISVDNEPCIIEVKVSYNAADGTYELVTGEKQVKINSDKFEYIEKDKSYQTTKLVTGLNGTVSSSDSVKALRLEVYNSRNELFLTDEITPADNWNDEGFVLDLGKNRVRVSAEYKDGSIVTDELCVNNVIKGLEDLVIDYDDNDNDGICNMIEDVIGTDKNNADTDGDRISDYNEVMILLTDPTVKDSDENGVEDGDEDKD